MYALAMRKVLMEDRRTDARTKTAIATGDPSVMLKQAAPRDWYRASQLHASMVLGFVDLPLNVVLLCHDRQIVDEDSGTLVETTLALPASARGPAMDAVGILGYMEPRAVTRTVRGKKRRVWEDRLYVGPSTDFPTKDKTNRLGDVVRRPTMPRIIKAWGAVTTTDEE
jgi:hypothetical protein